MSARFNCTLECGSEDAIKVSPPAAKWAVYICRNCAKEVAKAWAQEVGHITATVLRGRLEAARSGGRE